MLSDMGRKVWAVAAVFLSGRIAAGGKDNSGNTCATSDAELCNAAALPWRAVTAEASSWKPQAAAKPDGMLGSSDSVGTSRSRIHIVMQVTEPIGNYSRFAVATASIWARSHGYTLSVHEELPGGTAEHPTPGDMDLRFGKVRILLDHAESCLADWLLWLDSDVFMLVQVRIRG